MESSHEECEGIPAADFEDQCLDLWQQIVDEDPDDVEDAELEGLSEEQRRRLSLVARRAREYRVRDNTIGPSFPDDLQLIKKIGSGGMADVFLCEEKGTGRNVAVKVLRQMTQEASVIGEPDTEHVIRVYRVLRLKSGQPAIVMQFAEGGTLDDAIQNTKGGLEQELMRKIMIDAAHGMKGLAGVGVVHRDLKPSNILLFSDSFAKVSDFGLACPVHNLRATANGAPIVGTPAYMAPEQAMDPSGVDQRSDVYSFGATFYHAWTGRLPFPLKAGGFASVIRRHGNEPLTSLDHVRSGIDPAIASVIERSLAKNPVDRFQTFEEILEVLEERRGSDPAEEGQFETFVGGAIELLSQAGSTANGRVKLEVPLGASSRSLIVEHGEITQCVGCVDAIVSADDHEISMGGGVSRAIAEWAGPLYRGLARMMAPAEPGTSIVTPIPGPAARDCRFVIHGITRRSRNKDFFPTVDLIRQIVHSCGPHIRSLGIQRIAFPLLGTGVGELSHEACLRTMCEQLLALIADQSLPLKEARIIVFSV